jgi:hypothetical protein
MQVTLMRVLKKISVGLVALTFAGCGLTETRDNLALFDFTEVTPGPLETAMDASGQGRQILFLGQTPAPSRCYSLVGSLSSSSSTVTVTVTARQTNASCAGGTGYFRYTGSVEMARAGTYNFVVRHVFPSGTMAMTTLSKEVVVQ